jgi:hypothetical protein
MMPRRMPRADAIFFFFFGGGFYFFNCGFVWG